MARKRGNPNWGRKPAAPIPVIKSSFEKLLDRLGLKEECESAVIHSIRVRAWAAKNRNIHFIPEKFLLAWGFSVSDVGD